MTSPRILKPKTVYLLFRTKDLTGKPFGNHNTDVSVYISGPLHDRHDRSDSDPWRGKAAWANPVPRKGDHHHPNRTLSFHRIKLRQEPRGFFLWEIMPADVEVEKRLQNMFVRKKHYKEWSASKVCMEVLRNLHGDHYHDNLLYDPITPEHSRGVLQTINAAETGRAHVGKPILLPSDLTILRATPGEDIYKVMYDDTGIMPPVLEPLGYLTKHPHVHGQPHHHRKDYPSDLQRPHPNRHRSRRQHRSLRQLSSLAKSRRSPSSRVPQYYYDPKRPRQSSYPITATQHPIPAEVVAYPANSQADPRIYGSPPAPMSYSHPQATAVPVYGAAQPPPPAVDPTRAYVPLEAPVNSSNGAPVAPIPAPSYSSQPDDTGSRLSASSRSSSHSSKRRPVPRRSSQYYYQPRRSRSRSSRSSYSSSRRSTSDSLREDESGHKHLGVREALSRIGDKLMARDGPPSFSGHSSSVSTD
ncbi:hypothetical protein CJF32_00008175 [Rutstroemia sp. NJR-2017a WRK4]|nr:hypothetical protein CJF32_00008175 [Rutstroemia sp. NJR-2017a WRK4]